MNNVVHLIDCMEFMKTVPDKYYELAIVDPPYGLGKRLSQGAGKLKNSALQNMDSEWDIAPKQDYFNELTRVAKNRIIWGANYFNMPPTRGIICWDKKQFMPTFSRWEYAWSSFDCPSKMYEVLSHENRIHPTQKPVALYKWLLTNYAKPKDKIFDSHVGSGSSRIACYDLGFDFEGCELNADYWQGQEDRFNAHIKQNDLFDKAEIQGLIYEHK